MRRGKKGGGGGGVTIGREWVTKIGMFYFDSNGVSLEKSQRAENFER